MPEVLSLSTQELKAIEQKGKEYYADLLERFKSANWVSDECYMYLTIKSQGDDYADQLIEVGYDDNYQIDSLKQYVINKNGLDREINCLLKEEDIADHVNHQLETYFIEIEKELSLDVKEEMGNLFKTTKKRGAEENQNIATKKGIGR